MNIFGADNTHPRSRDQAEEVGLFSQAAPALKKDAVLNTDFLKELTDFQKEAALSNGPTLVLAGAGTGKTKTLTAAVARRLHEGVHAHRILAITFTNKAAQEMRERIVSLSGEAQAPAWMGTFHSIACRLLRSMPHVAGLEPNFIICDEDDSRRLMKEVLGKDANAEDVRAYLRAIENYKDWLCAPEEARANCNLVIARMEEMRLVFSEKYMRKVIPIYARYQDLLRSRNMADFSDLIMWVTRALENCEKTRQSIAARWGAVLVDEYQDVNNCQYRFVRALSRDHRELFVVGDDDQSIYGFRNAHVAFIRQFEDDFPDATVIRLEENFRSTQTILNAANAIIEMDEERLGKTLFTNNRKGSKIDVVYTGKDWVEGDMIVATIQQALLNSYRFSDIAILYRSNYLSLSLEKALSMARLPYKLVGDVSFWARREIKEAVDLLILAARKDSKQSDLAFRRVVNVPSRGIGEAKLAQITEIAEKENLPLFEAARSAKFTGKARAALESFLEAIEVAHEQVATRSLRYTLEELLDTTGYLNYWRKSKEEKAADRVQNLEQLLEYLTDQDDLDTFLEDIALVHNQDEADQNAISLMTVHRAKGMEFPVVILVGWEEGVFPSNMSMMEDRLDEEARLAYVAVTRCKEQLIITCCHSRRRHSGWVQPSRFLEQIPTKLVRSHQKLF